MQRLPFPGLLYNLCSAAAQATFILRILEAKGSFNLTINKLNNNQPNGRSSGNMKT